MMNLDVIDEFGCKNILYLMFESLSIYCLYQKRLVETMLFWRGLSSLKTSFWNSITVLKLLRALSNSSKRSSTIKIWYLNLCLLLQRARLCCSPFFSHRTFPHSNHVILLFFINLRMR